MIETGRDYANVSVLIPAYNEEQGIATTLQELVAEPRLSGAEIIVINDGSSDCTSDEVRAFPEVRLLEHRVNHGQGQALRTGARAAKRQYIAWFDADGQHRVEDLIAVVDTLIEDDLDYCVGVRDARSHEVRNRRAGKLILRMIINFVARQPVRDFNSGLRGFKRDVLLQYAHLLPRGFGASTTTTLLMLEQEHVGREVPIVVRERIGSSSVNQLRDGSRTLMIILHILMLFRPMQLFGAIGAALFATGMIYGLGVAFQRGQGFPVLAAVIVIMALQSFMIGLLADQISALRRERLDS